MGERLGLRHERRAGVLHEHEAAVEPALRNEERRQPVRRSRIEQSVQATVADRRDRHERQRERIERDRHGHPMEVAAAPDVVVLGQHDRVVRDAVHLDREHPANVRARVARGSVHLRRAPQRVGVLHQVRAVAMGGEDRRPREDGAKVGRARDLSRMRPEPLEAFVEGAVGPQDGLDGHRRGDVGGLPQCLGPFEREQPDREHPLGAVDERQPFLRLQRERCQPGPLERHPARQTLAPVGGFPLPDQRQGQVGQGGQEGSLFRNRRYDVEVQHLGHQIDDLRAHARVAERQNVGPEQEHRAGLLAGERPPHRRRVRRHDAVLQVGGLRRVDPGVGQRAEPGRDAVHRPVRRDRSVHDLARRQHARLRLVVEGDLLAAGNGDHVLGGEQLSKTDRHRAKATGSTQQTRRKPRLLDAAVGTIHPVGGRTGARYVSARTELAAVAMRHRTSRHVFPALAGKQP